MIDTRDILKRVLANGIASVLLVLVLLFITPCVTKIEGCYAEASERKAPQKHDVRLWRQGKVSKPGLVSPVRWSDRGCHAKRGTMRAIQQQPASSGFEGTVLRLERAKYQPRNPLRQNKPSTAILS